MEDVIYDLDWLKTADDRDLYYMYRDLHLSTTDHSVIKKKNLRYDITVIPPSNLGMEFVKTAGHYHPLIKGQEYTYPEVYEVLEGEAHYLLQKYVESPDKIKDVVFIHALKGDKVIIPPNYGHVTINPSAQKLMMSNWVSRDFSSIYEPYQRLGGAAYYELASTNLIPNEKYDELPELRQLKPTNLSEVDFHKKKDMYKLIRESEKLDYLNNPEKYDWLWELVLSDR